MAKRKMTDKGDEERERPSRSARKRASTALQKLGEELAALKPAQRRRLGLPPELMDALAMHDSISDHEGARRQRQYIGRLMRELDEVDAEAIVAAMERNKYIQEHPDT